MITDRDVVGGRTMGPTETVVTGGREAWSAADMDEAEADRRHTLPYRRSALPIYVVFTSSLFNGLAR